VVDGIARELEDEVRVVRLNTASRVGRQLAAHMTVRAVPTLLVIDGEGEVVLRQEGGIRHDLIVAAARDAGRVRQ
jgi:thioredoxin-related protein